MILDPDTRLTLEVPWPRYPAVTKTGRLSRSKLAGKPIPWLSGNIIHNLLSGNPNSAKSAANGRIRVHQIKVLWREAFAAAAREACPEERLEHPVRVEIILHRNPARETDVSALVEGAKPCLDGLVLAGLMADDGPPYVKGFDGGQVLHCPKGEQRVELRLRAA
jgi:hypothetical protein